ncbi:MAG: ribosome maturation factor RimM [Saprospiraceae bacterium]
MNYVQIGFTRKTHGVAGELKIVIEEPFEDLFLDADRVFLEVKGAKMPFLIKSVRGGGDLIVLFEDVANREEALSLQSRPVFLPESEIPEEVILDQPDPREYGYLIGFVINDRTAGEIGTVQDVLELPQQEMAVVNWKGKEVLVPLNKAFVVSIDLKRKEVVTDLPEGLLSL